MRSPHRLSARIGSLLPSPEDDPSERNERMAGSRGLETLLWACTALMAALSATAALVVDSITVVSIPIALAGFSVGGALTQRQKLTRVSDTE